MEDAETTITTMANNNGTPEQPKHTNTPWQLEWKDPQWISTEPKADDDDDGDDDDDDEIVGITSAHLSPSEISQLQNNNNNTARVKIDTDNHHCLLSITLLGKKQQHLPHGDSVHANRPVVASEVLLEVLEVPSHTTRTTNEPPNNARVLFSKRLRWPESIFSGTAAAAVGDSSASSSSVASSVKTTSRTKKKNLLDSLFLPLLGIDEDDEYTKPPNNNYNDRTDAPLFSDPNSGIVSATLCRLKASTNKDEDIRSATKDMVDLMSFGAIAASSGPKNNNNNSNNNTPNEPSTRDAAAAAYGPLSLACLSKQGKVFVYDPIHLLLGIDGASSQSTNKAETDAKRDLQQASSFFFGQDLFRTLEETWKPLAEPSNKIHLSLFEHEENSQKDRDRRRRQQRRGRRQQQNQKHTPRIGHGDDDDDDHSSAISTVSDHKTISSNTIASEVQRLHGAFEETLSKLPYLLNPLLEASTLKNRTVSNQPTEIAVAGSSCLVVIGTGTRPTKHRRAGGESSRSMASSTTSHHHRQNPKPTVRATHDDDDDDPSVGNVVADDKAVISPSEPNSRNDNTNDGENDSSTPEPKSTNPFADSDDDDENPTVEEEEEPSAAMNEDHSNAKKVEEPKREDDDRPSDNWWDEESAKDAGSVGNEVTTSKDDKGEIEAKADDKDSQRHYFDGYDKSLSDHNVGDEEIHRPSGGFVTFLSTSQWSETRTLFLPFAPLRVSHIAEWNRMELLWVIGESESLLIRMDDRAGPIPVSIRDVLVHGDDLFATDGDSLAHEAEGLISSIAVKKYQVLPVDLALNGSIAPRLLCASHTGVDPPSILELYVDPDANEETVSSQPALLVLKTLGYCTPQGMVVLRHAPSHVAKVPMHPNQLDSTNSPVSVWAKQGQGWSLLGSDQSMHFICWEGATLLQGAYVHELGLAAPQRPFCTTHILQLSSGPMQRSLSLFRRPSDTRTDMGTDSTEDGVNPRRYSSAILPVSSLTNDTLEETDEYYDSNITRFSSPTDSVTIDSSLILSRRQNDEYLLQQCSSWTQLEDTLDDRIALDKHEPILLLRGGSSGSPHSMLSLRQLVVENGVSSPFQQVLAWLAKRKNFFVAAGIALDLLQDADTLYHLWKHAEMIDEEDEETKLVGLLDGISPVRLLDDDENQNDARNKCKYSVTATHLSEMTVGCFIKGGVNMAKTLVQFLETNRLYDPAHVSLMLSLTTTNVFSGGEIEDLDALIWPIECLLKIGTKRNYLKEVLTLLNNAIPDQLRNRAYGEEGKTDEEKASKPNLALTQKLIKMLLASAPSALDILMSFVDYDSQLDYWQSLDHKTRLSLSLMEINDSSLHPFLKHPQVRVWARKELDACFRNDSILPTAWLQELSIACLKNANCDLSGFCAKNPVGKDFVDTMKSDIEKTRSALLVPGSGLDYDLLIPALLLLEHRQVQWIPSTLEQTSDPCVSTQSILDATCYLAGRPTAQTSSSKAPFLFAEFDSKSAMKQCFEANNVLAGANLIGGKNGFVLHICDILHKGTGMSIANAESFVVSDRLTLPPAEETKIETAVFELNDGYRKLLLLLDDHVLGIQTLGDFDVVHTRGRVDPVFAARSVLRAWLLLSRSETEAASTWLGDWLGTRLGIRNATPTVTNSKSITPRSNHKMISAFDKGNEPKDTAHTAANHDKDYHRLACASLVRSLLWPHNAPTPKKVGADNDENDRDSVPLAVAMKFEEKLLLELCRSCMGLLESVPPGVLQTIKV